MTNLILRQGYITRFQSRAVVYTNVPTGYRGLCKMLLRWARSNVRETIAFSRFAFGRFRSGPMSGARVNLLLSWFKLTLGEALKLSLIWSFAAWPLLAGHNLIIGLVAASIPPALFYFIRTKSSDFLWAFPYTLFWLAGLSWISLYALATPYKNGWLTREIKPAQGGVFSRAAQAVDSMTGMDQLSEAAFHAFTDPAGRIAPARAEVSTVLSRTSAGFHK